MENCIMNVNEQNPMSAAGIPFPTIPVSAPVVPLPEPPPLQFGAPTPPAQPQGTMLERPRQDGRIDEKRLLIINYACNPELQKTVAELEKRDNPLKRGLKMRAWDMFNTVTDVPYILMWRAIQIALTGGHTGALSMADLGAALERLPEFEQIRINEPAMCEVKHLAQEIDKTRSVPISEASNAHAHKLFVAASECSLVATFTKEGMDRETTTSRERFKQIGSFLESAITYGGESKPIALFADFNALPGCEFDRVNTGVPWLDKALGEGMSKDSSLFAIGPSGSGKTVLGTSMAYAKAMTGARSLYLSYEQKLSGDLLCRFYAMGSGMPRATFENKEFADYPQEAKDALQATCKRLGAFLMVKDMSGETEGLGGAPEIRKLLEGMERSGTMPELVVVDWVGCAVDRHMAKKGSKMVDRTVELDSFAREVSAIGRDLHCNIVLLHQTETQSQKSRSAEMHFSMSAGCKSLAFHCEYAVGWTRPDEKSNVRFFITKNRSCPLPELPRFLKLDGANNRFIDKTANVEYDPRLADYVNDEE